jgi:hypothetical protein
MMQSPFFITHLLSLRWQTNNVDECIGLNTSTEMNRLSTLSHGA